MVAVKKRAAVLISGNGSNLQAFIEQTQAGTLDLDIALVISNRASAYGLQRAQDAGIQHVCIQHQHYPTRLAFDRALIAAISQAQVDVVILAGFMRILSTEFVQHYRHKLLNIHPSLLPKYPGQHTHQRALDANEQWHGASVHFVVPEVDMGPVILQGRLAIQANETLESLQQRIHLLEHQIYPTAVRWFIQGRLTVRQGQTLLDDEIRPEQLQNFHH